MSSYSRRGVAGHRVADTWHLPEGVGQDLVPQRQQRVVRRRVGAAARQLHADEQGAPAAELGDGHRLA